MKAKTLNNRPIFKVFTAMLFMLILSVCASCEKKVGFATAPKFSPKDVLLSGNDHQILLKAKNDVKWFLADFTINGELLRPEDWDNDKRIRYYSTKEKDQHYPHTQFININKIEFEDWFTWEKLNNKTIQIHLRSNTEDKPRTVSFQASVGNAIDDIRIQQDPLKSDIKL